MLFVKFEVLTVVVMKVAIFWDTMPCSPYMNRHFKGTHHLQPQGQKSFEQEIAILTVG
jgi:hypothetical protein